MGFFGSMGSAIVSTVSSVGRAISSAVSTAGRCITEGCAKLANGLGNLLKTGENLLKAGLEKTIEIVATIAEVVKAVAEFILKRPVEEPDELGAKMQQEDVRERRSDESMAEYLDYLREQVKLDKEKFEKMSEEEKLACKVLGTSAIATAVSEETNVSFSPEFLLAIEKCKMTDKQVLGYINQFRENGIDSLDKVVEYLEDASTLSDDERLTVQDALREAELELNPEMTEEQFLDLTDNMKELVNKPLEENPTENSLKESESVEDISLEQVDGVEDNSLDVEADDITLDESLATPDSNLEDVEPKDIEEVKTEDQ